MTVLAAPEAPLWGSMLLAGALYLIYLVAHYATQQEADDGQA